MYKLYKVKCCLINQAIVCGAEVCEGFCVECRNLGSEEERTRSREDCDLLIIDQSDAGVFELQSQFGAFLVYEVSSVIKLCMPCYC